MTSICSVPLWLFHLDNDNIYLVPVSHPFGEGFRSTSVCNVSTFKRGLGHLLGCEEWPGSCSFVLPPLSQVKAVDESECVKLEASILGVTSLLCNGMGKVSQQCLAWHLSRSVA